MSFSRLQNRVVACSIIFLTACSNSHVDFETYDSGSRDALTQALYAQLAEWQKVKYRWGGMSKDGIDCSGFVYLTFQKRWGIKLPRTTKKQALSGKIISQENLKAGDLVFFKTGVQQRHVGIYVEQRKFIHVSKRKGVTLSRLDNAYWRKKYWQAVRVLDLHQAQSDNLTQYALK